MNQLSIDYKTNGLASSIATRHLVAKEAGSDLSKSKCNLARQRCNFGSYQNELLCKTRLEFAKPHECTYVMVFFLLVDMYLVV